MQWLWFLCEGYHLQHEINALVVNILGRETGNAHKNLETKKKKKRKRSRLGVDNLVPNFLDRNACYESEVSIVLNIAKIDYMATRTELPDVYFNAKVSYE